MSGSLKTQILEIIIFESFSNQYFWFMEKCQSYNFHLRKKNNQRPFMHFSVLMELPEKCMISIFSYMKNV